MIRTRACLAFLLTALALGAVNFAGGIALGAEDFGGQGITRAQYDQFLPPAKPHPFGQSEHTVLRLNGEKKPTSLPAEMQWISQPWNGENAQLPYLVYMPEKDRLLMLVMCGQPVHSALTSSDDHGKTWSPRRWLSVDKAGQPDAGGLGLTYLGDGRLVVFSEDNKVRWVSADYGQTWERKESKVPPEERYAWDPLLLVPGANGRIESVAQGCWKPTGVAWASDAGPYSQGYVRVSPDEGQTWGESLKVPQWLGVNEVNILIARNGDWVAACRTDYPKRFAHFGLDHYGGLGVSISKDKGKTWSTPKMLYEWGRHHPSMTLLPGGGILMSYVVRLGYPDNAQKLPQFGVEAVVSRDHGQTWDLDHRYVLAAWGGNITGGNAWYCSPQSTATVLLSDGMILTAFGTGFRNTPTSGGCKMDIALVKWRMTQPAGTADVFVPNGKETIESSLYQPGPAAAPRDKGPIRLSTGPHLWIDDFLIEKAAGIHRRMNSPIRDPQIPNPLIDGKTDGCVAPYLTVIRDPQSKRFRIWYDKYKQEQPGYSSDLTVMESADGIHWERPPQATNLNVFNASVFDHGAGFSNPAERYKLSWWMGDRLRLFASPDGLQWTEAAQQPNLARNGRVVTNVGDIHNICWDPLRKRFMATFGIYTTGPTWSGLRRVTLQSVSPDLVHWERPWFVITPVDAKEPGQTQFYMMSGYIFRGPLCIGLVKILHDDQTAAGVPAGAFGTGHTALAWTRDGKHWVRDPAPFFEPDPKPDTWDHAHAWMDVQFPMGDETYIYYGGYKYGHKMDPQQGRYCGLVRMKRDRYVSRDAGAEGGTLLTPPVVLAGNRLSVNAKIEGELRVRIRDAAGNAVPGFDAADCRPVRGDSLAHAIEWTGAPSLGALGDKEVKLEFLVKDGQLYGFELAE